MAIGTTSPCRSAPSSTISAAAGSTKLVPDKRLAQAAFRAARPGVFPLGAQGAGRLAVRVAVRLQRPSPARAAPSARSAQVKVAAFVVVNALGVVTTRDGKVAACYGDEAGRRT